MEFIKKTKKNQNSSSRSLFHIFNLIAVLTLTAPLSNGFDNNKVFQFPQSFIQFSDAEVLNKMNSKKKLFLFLALQSNALQSKETDLKNYPGALDEEDLKVQKSLTEPSKILFRKKVIEQIYKQKKSLKKHQNKQKGERIKK